MEKAKLEYHDLQKAMQQIASKTNHEKSKLEGYDNICSSSSRIQMILSREYRKKCELAKARIESLQQKEKHYRELMIKLTGNTEKR